MQQNKGAKEDWDTNGSLTFSKPPNLWGKKRESSNKCLEKYVTTYKKINFIPIFLPLQGRFPDG